MTKKTLISPTRAIVSDDDEFFRVAIQSILREMNGFSEVIGTNSLAGASNQLAKSKDFDLGLFDINMVAMESWADLAAIRTTYPDMRLVVVSGSRNRDDVIETLRIGAHGFIHKGQGVSELSRAVKSVCEGQVYVPPFLAETVAQRDLVQRDGPTVANPEPPVQNTSLPDGADADANSGETESVLRCTPRQREIIDLLIAGQSNKGMARTLDLSEGTVKFHMSAVLRLLGATNRVEAATRAMAMLSDRR